MADKYWSASSDEGCDGLGASRCYEAERSCQRQQADLTRKRLSGGFTLPSLLLGKLVHRHFNNARGLSLLPNHLLQALYSLGREKLFARF